MDIFTLRFNRFASSLSQGDILRKSSLRAIALVGAVLAASATVLAPTAANAAGGTYYPSGPQVNVPLSTVTAGGWVLCWSEDYGTRGTTVSSILAGTAAGSVSSCDEKNIMLTGWAKADPTILPVLAVAPKVDVFTATTRDEPHLVNGSYWYYTPDWSMGFSPNATIAQNSCDVAGVWGDGGDQAHRLCWHMGGDGLNGGWSLGDQYSLNSNVSYVRAIFKQQMPSLHKGSTTNAGALGRALKLTQPVGGSLAVSVSDASSSACRVQNNKVVAFAIGTCEVTVASLKANGDTKASASRTYEVK